MNELTAEHKLKHLIALKSTELYGEISGIRNPKSSEEIDDIYEVLCEKGYNHDAEEELREGEVETGIYCDYSRHYESKSVAMQYIDGSWIGWTYWYGGGKHGEPEAIDWIDKAYDLDCNEEEKLVIVRSFSKKV